MMANMLTKNDIDRLEKRFRKIFVTKEEFQSSNREFQISYKDLKSTVQNMSDGIIDLLNLFRKEVKDEFSKYKEEADDILEDHEQRITKLESS